MTTLLFAGNKHYPAGGMNDMLLATDDPAGISGQAILDAIGRALQADRLEHDDFMWVHTVTLSGTSADAAKPSQVTRYELYLDTEEVTRGIKFASLKGRHPELGYYALVPVSLCSEDDTSKYPRCYATLDPEKAYRW